MLSFYFYFFVDEQIFKMRNYEMVILKYVLQAFLKLLETASVIKKRDSATGLFLWILWNFCKTPISIEYPWWLILKVLILFNNFSNYEVFLFQLSLLERVRCSTSPFSFGNHYSSRYHKKIHILFHTYINLYYFKKWYLAKYTR